MGSVESFEFQFHKVRLKEYEKNKKYTKLQFQFHKVRLKERRREIRGRLNAVSIP